MKFCHFYFFTQNIKRTFMNDNFAHRECLKQSNILKQFRHIYASAVIADYNCANKSSI